MGRMSELKKYVEENREVGLDYCAQIFNLNRLSDTDVFYHVVFCLLVPAGNAKQTDKAVQHLRQIDYMNTTVDDITLYSYLRPYVRFPRQKAIRLHSFKRSAKSFIKGLKSMVKGGTSSHELRDYLRNRVKGMGYKAASHFLRDIGALDLAIVDTHVLKYKPYFMPKDKQHYEPGSPKQYLEIEEYFMKWAYEEFDMAPAHLDWFLWCKESGNPITALEY